MRIIYKYPLSVDKPTLVDVPYQNARLSIGEDNLGQLCAWYLQVVGEDQDDLIQRFEFKVYGTGEQINDRIAPFDDGFDVFSHSDTVVMKSGVVWHVFCRQRFE
jgi:hypothetical protein